MPRCQHLILHPRSNTLISLYVHVPFCASRCGYCDFNTYTAKELGGGVAQDNFHEYLIAEITMAAHELGSREVSTVFIGGGTPTLIGSAALNEILQAIGNNFSITSDTEITTEANPDSVDYQSLVELKAGGFTRISFGMQSVASNVLAVLQRTHTPGASAQAARWATEAGFDHINLDLIYGTPGESDADVRASVQVALDAGVDHVSAYSLIVEDATPLARAVRAGVIAAPDDDVCADRFQIIDEQLTTAGMQWYEVSNWAHPGGECRHNQAYWNNATWWGIGPGAHSHRAGRRWWNHKHPKTYAHALEAGDLPIAGEEILTAEQQHSELVMLAMRTRQGLAASELTDSESARAQVLARSGLIDHQALDDGRVRISASGRLLADRVVRELLG